MNRETKKQIEAAFYAYEQLKERAREELQDIAESRLTARYDAVRVAGGKTGSKVEHAALKAYQNNLWATVVDNTMIRFRFGVEYEIIVLKYIHKKSDVESYLLLHLAERTYYFYVDKILAEAEQWAITFGLMGADTLS